MFFSIFSHNFPYFPYFFSHNFPVFFPYSSIFFHIFHIFSYFPIFLPYFFISIPFCPYFPIFSHIYSIFSRICLVFSRIFPNIFLLYFPKFFPYFPHIFLQPSLQQTLLVTLHLQTTALLQLTAPHQGLRGNKTMMRKLITCYQHHLLIILLPLTGMTFVFLVKHNLGYQVGKKSDFFESDQKIGLRI